MVLAVPILLSASVIHLLAIRPPEVQVPTMHSSQRFQQPQAVSVSYSYIRQLVSWLLRRSRRVSSYGDVNFTRASVYFLLLPSMAFLFYTTQRKLTPPAEQQTMDANAQLMEAGNVQGLLALIVLGSVLLLPVARDSAFLRVFQWNPICAVQLHVWTGRLIILCSCLHGGMHLYRWKYLLNEQWTTMLLPPRQCYWMLSQDDAFEPVCYSNKTDCSCYDLFRNLTGILAGIGLIVIGISSLNVVRRSMYTVFYKIHILAGPLVMVMVILHWNRSILYMAGGLLFYMASSFPSFVETKWRQYTESRVKIVGVKILPALDTCGQLALRSCVSLTIEASSTAMTQYRAGQYMQLQVPTISNKSHPFSINTVPDQSHQLRILFRVTGPFTTALARQLLQTPKHVSILMNGGYHGAASRVQQVLQHDTVVFVAGGIGITPYLSLLHRVHAIVSLMSRRMCPLKRIVVHWMCRDPSLIAYIQHEYLDPLVCLPGTAVGLHIKIVIHHTDTSILNDSEKTSSGSSIGSTFTSFPMSDMENPQDDYEQTDDMDTLTMHTHGLPFVPSQFTTVSKPTVCANGFLFVYFAVTVSVGLFVTWFCYSKVQSGNRVLSRLWAPVILLTWVTIMAVGVNVLGRRWNTDQAVVSAEWTALSTVGDDSLEMSNVDTNAASMDKDGRDAIAIIRDDLGDDERMSSVKVEDERKGRPSVHCFVNEFDDARSPGIFACGPESLLKAIRGVVKERCSVRLRQCIRGESRIALYEESFEL